MRRGGGDRGVRYGRCLVCCKNDFWIGDGISEAKLVGGH
jgi:hypothetical protein